MAQDVFSKMAEEPWLLNEDGYLNADTDIKEIIYHPTLNVILICTNSGIVRVLDVNSGVVLQSSHLSAINQNEVTCRYIAGPDRILFSDGQALGVRSDYNGVLLLDSILQKVISDPTEEIKVELPLSEAIILKESLTSAGLAGIDHVINELTDVISNAQKHSKKGIKAQKWNTVCLRLPLSDLRSATVNSITDLLAKHQQTPELAVASAVQERMSELLGEPANASDRRAMASESKRRDTFSQWPHMDYKWALPEQMAQAGFYHQPNASGDDRAMCFTCTVCLVCWERTDEPWSEHERHSQNCPFVNGEYTQNIPLSVTYATGPAIDATYRGVNVKTIGTSTVTNMIPTANSDGLISVFDISGKIKRTHSFFVTQFDSHILERFTQEFGVLTDCEEGKYPAEKSISALTIVSAKQQNNVVASANNQAQIRPTIVCGLGIRCKSSISRHASFSVESLNDQNKNDHAANIMEVSYSSPESSCLYLVVYDFMYCKEQDDADNKSDHKHLSTKEAKDTANNTTEENEKNVSEFMNHNGVDPIDMDISMSPNYLMKHLSSFYKTLIPGDSDEVFLAPTVPSTKTYSGPRFVPLDSSETDSSPATSYIINQDYIFMNGLQNFVDPFDKSISDHINELKSSKSTTKLNYSRAVQCFSLPDQYKNRRDLIISDIVTTQDGRHILVVLKSLANSKSVLLLYLLDFAYKMVKVDAKPVLVRELCAFEKPVEVSLLPAIEKLGKMTEHAARNDVEGNVVLVCADGAVRIVGLSTLRTICYAKLDSEKFVSAAYCNSLERLCASTEKGSLHFYALNDTDNESLEDHEEDDLFGLNLDCPSVSSAQQSDSPDTGDTTRYFQEPPEPIYLCDLKRLHALTSFEPLKAGYCAVVPPSWSEIQQAQRQRRHPQSLNIDCEQYTKTWRLQTDITTWDEHIFEITLPSPMSLGHVDVNITLQSAALSPHVEVTLLRQNASGIGHKRDVKFSVDETVTIDILQWADNPVISQEYLRAHNADILAGPVNLASCLDLTDQSGVVTLTSPKLFKSRNRTLLLHLRVVYTKEEENNKNNVKGKRGTDAKNGGGGVVDKSTYTSSRKAEFYMGCDCIHELSITVYTSKHTDIPYERVHRNLMLESTPFVQSLILTAVADCTEDVQGFVLDILNWLASIRLTRNRSNYGEAPYHQVEFLNVVENNLPELLQKCLLTGGRSIAHRCAKLVTICCSGAKNISEQIGTNFDGCVLNTLLHNLESISRVKSAAGLQWLLNLLLSTTAKGQDHLLSALCVNLLTKVSDELDKRSNPYHLLLRSRYGLYGTPMEPELFDIDPPPYPKGSSTSITYASVVSGDSPITNSNFYANYSFYKESISPKEVLSVSENKMKCKNVTPAKIFKGLIETEPLHFHCVSASEGTRLDRADDASSLVSSIVVNNMPADIHSSYISSSTKKEEVQHFWSNVVEIVSQVKNSKTANSTISEKLVSTLKNPLNSLLSEDVLLDNNPIQLLSDAFRNKVENKSTSSKSVWQTEDILSPENQSANLWQHLFVTPPQQVIVVERMHSGARRFVTLDFGQPVILTDVLIPSCIDLVSISIDVWLKSEDADPVRLVVASDIGTRNLILNDLQPLTVCRYMKITAVGRYGMSTTRCRIPIGYFYGHMILLPDQIPHEIQDNVSAATYAELDKHLINLAKLFEDIGCRYSLSCSKLKEALQGFIVADVKNASHLLSYMNIMKDKNSNVSTEHNKIFQAYREAITYQRQLNTVRHIMNRVENSPNTSHFELIPQKDFSNVSTDKLRSIAEGLLEVLLSLEFTNDIQLPVCQKLFHGLCVSQSPRLQFLAAIFLKNSAGKKNYWGNFLSDTLAEMFSTSYTLNFPQDRVFILIAYLSKRSPQRSSVIDAALRVIYQCLSPLNQQRRTLLAISVDLPLLSWLLMYLSLQLDLNKNSAKSIARWDWVFGEMVGRATVESTRSRLAKVFKPSLSQNVDNKMPSIKGPKLFMKMYSVTPGHLELHGNENAAKKPKKTSETSPEKNSPKRMPLYVDAKHCLAVAKGLLNLVLSMDHSSSADMLLLSFKVIARLSMLVKLRLGQLMNEDQLLKLIYFCLASKIPWAPHALACLLEDIMDLSAPPPREDLEMETDTSASTSWATGDYDNENVNLEDNLLISALPTPCKTSSTPKNNQLASVYEYDDSELEELMEDFLDKEQSTKKHPPKSSSQASSLNSCAVDSRLDAGVEIFPEIALRKLIGNNTQTLVQNITAGASCAEREEGLTAWSSAVLPFQQESPMTNHKMLKHCFQELFENLQVQSPASIEHVLQLWLTLSVATRGDKFDPSTSPSVALNCEGIRALIGTLAWAPGLTLVTWCVALQTLTLACNTLTMSTISTPRLHWGEMMGLATVIVDHPDFVQFLLRLLSGTGVVSSEKGLAGPSLCKALHDLLVRLQMRCDIVSPCSKMGGNLKTLLLKVVYQLVQPSGPIACRQGPLDAQCKIVQSMLHIDFCNADLGIAMSILESTGTLVHTYVTNADRVKCNNSGDFSNATFRHLYSTVLGADPNKQDRPVSSEVLLITLLKLLGKLVKTPFPNDTDSLEAMDTEPPATTSQTDESKAEQIQQDSARNPQVPCLADIALQHHPSIIRLCSSLAACKTSSLCMLACLSQKHAFVSNFSEPNTIADGVFHILISLAKNASKKDLLMQPLLMFLSQTPQLSEPLLWFILQVLDTGDTIRSFMNAGGIGILGRSFVTSSNTPSTISKMGTISTVMQYFNKTNRPSECNLPTSSSTSKKSPMDDQLENRLSLVNFAPCSTIRCNSTTAQPAEVLILGGTTTHRRARTPQWSYHFYPEEVYTELVLQLPSAILLKQVHLQPHLIALSTCPSAVGLEVSANGPSRLVPVCPPIATSGMSYIQLDLPVPEVVNCVLIRLYKPRTANNISLSQIRLLGFPAFTGKVPVSFMIDDELHCKHSLGWLRLLHHCFTLPANEELVSSIVACCAQVPNLLTTACGLLLVPSHILPDYLPCLEKVLRELSLHNLDSGIITMRVLLESRCSSIELLNASENMWQDRLLVNTNGYQSACELLYQICEHQDGDTCYRVSMILEWLQTVARQALATENIYECNPAYISCVASILWYANRDNITYNLKALITSSFYDSIYKLKVNVEGNTTLKYSLDSLLCSICYIKPEFYPMLLQNIGILVPNSSSDRGASISDDRKDHESMTDDIKETFGLESNWYSHLVVDELCQLNLSNEQLETLALVSRSPSSIKQLLDSGLTKILNDAILEFATNDENVVPMAKLENVTAILKFFTDVCEEKSMRDWLGSTDGSSFWLHLLHWLCRKTTTKKYNLQSETHAQLEEMCIRFLSKCCLCHPMNQNRLAKVLCEVISLQSNGVTGFMRRLILQLLLENEKIPVSITADETLYKSVRTPQVYLPSHPAFKQTYKRALLYLSTSTTLSDILEEHIYFNPHKLENTTISKKPQNGGGMRKDAFKGLFNEDSDLSVAAGVLAKDKRAKDNKNLMNSLVSNNTTTTTTGSSTPVKKKRYTSDFASPELIGGRLIRCESYSDQSLPLSLNLGQLLKLIESNRMTTDWPCVHLTVSPGKGSDDKSTCNSSSSSTSSSEVSCSLTQQQPYSSALQVFSAMGGLALLAQHLPTVYPETVRPQPTEKINPEPSDSEWIKVEDCDDIYEEETVGSSSPSKTTGIVPNVPPHSLTAFGLFLRLPGYAEILLKDMKEALCLLRLVLGVTDDGEGGDIFQLPVANSLPTLPFEVLRKLYDTTRLNTDDGRLLRRISINSGVVHLLLACLGIFTHQTPNSEKDGSKDAKSKEERSQLYWAKGTGFGTGSTQQSWNVEQALLKQRSEEEHVTVLLQVLASYINPNGEASDELAEDVLPPSFYDLLANSSLLPALSSYLRNDSVLDMARHIPLYKAALQLLRALAVSSQLVGLLLPQKSRMNDPSICSLLKNMKNCVDTYASKLRINSKTESKMKSKLGEQQLEEVEQGEGLATLMPDIQDTANLVSGVTNGMIDSDHDSDIENMLDRSMAASLEERYLKIMKNLQFASYEMITDLKEGGVKFVISHHFESNAKSTSEQSHPSRVKRIAQEAVTLSSSLPLSYSSSVFVRYDTSRLDVMKVLITGPSDTPYANGCFELDVFFPQDYPTSPMMINLETTGHHSVRFNPNLYNDGKVCLSVLNTWHGRPEEKWNAQTSSFLQVLVSIQSLILVPEPYFNEPGYERSRGTPAGSQSSKEYNATICQATVRWAMLEQMLNPCPCFKDIILTHFYLKRYEIIEQVDGWVKDLENDTSEKRPSRSNKRSPTNNLENFKKVVQQLKDQLLKMKTPVSLDDEECETSTTPTNSIEVTVDTPVTELENEHAELDTDIEMEKMVNEMCE